MTDQEIIILKDVEEYFDKYKNLSYKAYFKNEVFYLEVKEGKNSERVKCPFYYFKGRNNKRVIEQLTEECLYLLSFK